MRGPVPRVTSTPIPRSAPRVFPSETRCLRSHASHGGQPVEHRARGNPRAPQTPGASRAIRTLSWWAVWDLKLRPLACEPPWSGPAEYHTASNRRASRRMKGCASQVITPFPGSTAVRMSATVLRFMHEYHVNSPHQKPVDRWGRAGRPHRAQATSTRARTYPHRCDAWACSSSAFTGTTALQTHPHGPASRASLSGRTQHRACGILVLNRSLLTCRGVEPLECSQSNV